MKKFLLILSAVALLLVGCAKEQLSNGADGGMTTATFTARVDGGVVSKAVVDVDGNGAKVNRCIMEIYFQNELYMRMVKPTTEKVATFANVPVVAGKQYQILFWADCGGAEMADLYYTTTDLKTVTVAKDAFEGALAAGKNDELDAFFFAEERTVPQSGDNSYNVTLKRPFAQLNVITTDVGTGKTVFSEDLLPEKVSVSYKADNTINVATGAISKVGESEDDYTFTYEADVYGAWSTVTTDHKELTLSMDYILASTEQGTVDVTFKTFNNGDANPVMNHNLANLPYKRNYRTNVKGDLLTTAGSWTATIAPAWGDGEDSGEIDHIIASSYTDVVNALQSGNDSKNMKVTVTHAAVNNLSDAEKAQVIVDETIDGAPVKALKFVLYEEKTTGEDIHHASPEHVEFELPARPADVAAWKIEYEPAYPTETVVVSTKEEDNANIIIEAPKSTVTLDAAKINSVVSTTSENTLIIPQGLELKNLIVKKGAVEYHGVGLEKVTVNALEGANVYFKTSEGLANTDAVYGVVKNYVAPGYAITKESETTWKIVPEVCKIGSAGYGSLADAVAAVPTDGSETTITMVNDFATTENVEIAAAKNVVLDLNGKKISYTTDGYGSFIENRGQLKIKDSGSTGIITAEFSAPNWNNGCYTIDNFGASPASKLVIESGTIENTSPAGLAWPINNGSWGTSADLVINGGTIHSTNYVPVREYLQYGGKKTIVINGGKLISDNSRAIAVQLNDAEVADQGSYVEINGGEFSCNGSGILYVDLHAANLNTEGFTMTVNGGKFKNANADAPVLVYDNEGKDQSSAVLLSGVLKGGVYSKKPADEIVAEGRSVKENADPVYPWKVELSEPFFTIIFTNGSPSKTFNDVFAALAAAKEFEESGANGQAIITHSQYYDGYPNAFLGDSYIPNKQYTGEVEEREYKFGPVLSTRSYDNFNLFDDSFGFYAFNPKKTLNHSDGSKVSELEAVMALVNNENVGTNLSNLSGLMQMMIESGMLTSDEQNFMNVYNLVRSFAFDEYGSIQQIPLSLAAVFNADIPMGSVILSGHYANGYESFMGHGWVNMEMGEGSGTSVPEYNQWMYGIYPYSGQAEDNTLPAGKPVNMPMNTSPYNCSVYSQYNHFYDWHPVFADYLDNMFVLDCAVTNLSEGNTGKKMTALVSVPLSEKIIYVLGSKEYTLKSPNEDRVFIATNYYDAYTNTVN